MISIIPGPWAWRFILSTLYSKSDLGFFRATLRKVHRDPGEPYIDEDEEELETTELERTETMRSLGIRNKQRFIVDIEEDEED